jgi:hypothetical protein
VDAEEEALDRAIAAAVSNGEEAPRIKKALELAVQYGGIDGQHHRAWVIDQVVRALAGDKYDDVVRAACAGADGPETYDWEVGIAP